MTGALGNYRAGRFVRNRRGSLASGAGWGGFLYSFRNAAIFLLLLAVAAPLAAPARGDSLRFAWLSDTHVGSANGARDLRRAVDTINSLPGIAFAIVSGDITEAGSLAQYHQARRVLDDLKIPCRVIPGNHDTKWSDSGGAWFGRVFGAARFVFDSAGLRFIGLHQGPVMKMGDGHFAPEDLRWLDGQLAKTAPGQPVIFVTHMPLNNSTDNWFEASERLRRVNTQAVLAGHGHANRKLDFEGLPGVMGRSSLHDAKKHDGPGYTIVEIKDEVMSFAEKNVGKPAGAPWCSIKIEKRVCADGAGAGGAGAGGERARPDYSVNEKFPRVKVVWQRELGWTIASSPALCGESVIVGDASGKVRAFALGDGRELWEFASGGAVFSTPAVEGGRVVFASTDGCVYALDAGSGGKIWEFRTDMPIVASPRVEGGVVYIGAGDGKFRALDLGSGKLLWEFAGLRGFVETRALVCEGKVIFGAWDEHLYALDAKTGALAWKWKGPRRGALYSPAACWPVAANGKVFVVAPDRRVTALRVGTGEEVWGTMEVGGRESIGVSGDGASVFVRSMHDTIAALATAPDKPVVLWKIDAGFGTDFNSAMLVEKDGALFYGTKNGVLYAIDSRTGKIRWRHRVGPTIINTVVALDSRRVLFGDFDGKLALVEGE